ncbi:MAG: hypothetical protein K2X99_03555, partial [Gemmatimonadaceae bacterium]|nr:hypothetical protein [Gemmatimonadaceae bacterium]
HPDERVPLALLQGAWSSRLATEDGWALHLYARAVRDADAEGTAWTPLLDRMAAAGVWPKQRGRVFLSGRLQIVEPRSVEQHLEPVRTWARTQTDPEALAELDGFDTPALKAKVTSRRAALQAVTQEFRAPAPAATSAPVSASDADSAPIADESAVAARTSDPITGPTLAPEVRLTDAQVEGLLRFSQGANGKTELDQVRPEVRRAIDVLIAYERLPSEALGQLYQSCRRIKEWVIRIVAHGAATIELWRNALRDNNWLEVRLAVAKSRLARGDAVIRRMLSRSTSADVICALCRDGDQSDLGSLVRRVVRVDPQGVLSALRDAAAEALVRLTPADLLPLLQHEDAAIRDGAIALLPRLARA